MIRHVGWLAKKGERRNWDFVVNYPGVRKKKKRKLTTYSEKQAEQVRGKLHLINLKLLNLQN